MIFNWHQFFGKTPTPASIAAGDTPIHAVIRVEAVQAVYVKFELAEPDGPAHFRALLTPQAARDVAFQLWHAAKLAEANSGPKPSVAGQTG